MQHQLVKIVWKDAFAGSQGWTALEEYHPEPALPQTVGWLLEGVLDGYVTTADTYLVQDDDVTYYNIGHIPIEMIVTMEVIELEDKPVPKKRRKK